MIRKQQWPLTALLVLLLAPLTMGHAPAADTEDPRTTAAMTRALRATLQGDPAALAAEAAEARSREKAGSIEPPIADNLAALAAVSREPMPRITEFRSAMKGFERDQLVRNLERLIRRTEPRQAHIEAIRDRRYESIRSAYNSIVLPFVSVVQGQFFALFSVPFDAADHLVTGRLYLTPEQRRELYTARAAASSNARDSITESARDLEERWSDRRRLLSGLQAGTNGSRALKDGDLQTATFWFETEKVLRGWTKNRRAGHRQALIQVARAQGNRNRALSVVDGDSLFTTPAEFAAYTTTLRSLLLPDASVDETARRFLVDFPRSAGADDAMAALAGDAARRGDPILARVELQGLVDSGMPGPWRERAQAYIQSPEHDPRASLQVASDASAARFRGFLFEGRDPTVIARSLTAEESRQNRRRPIDRARGLFITDTITRAMALPLIGGFPQPEMADAGARIDDDWYSTEEGREWRRRVMKAQAREQRFEAAAASARFLGDFRKAAAYDDRAARRLEKAAESAETPAQAQQLYERLLNAYPVYKRRSRVEKALETARLDAATRARIPRNELGAYPELWRGGGLRLPDALLDGNKSNGEIDKDGVALLAWDAVVYTDAATGNRVEIPIAGEDRTQVIRMLEPRRRAKAVEAALKEKPRRGKLPLAVEAGAFPGFDVAPGLMPLRPDDQTMRLYE